MLKKLDKEMNGQYYLLDIWYFQDGYGVAAKNNSDVFIKHEIFSYLDCGVIDDDIDCAEKQIQENEEFGYDDNDKTNKSYNVDNPTNFSLN